MLSDVIYEYPELVDFYNDSESEMIQNALVANKKFLELTTVLINTEKRNYRNLSKPFMQVYDELKLVANRMGIE